MASTKLSPATYDRLQAELEDLKTRGRVEIARHIEAARALGDLSENGDYHAAKDSQGKMEARIRQLEAILNDAEVVEGGGPADEVATGVTVRLRYVGDDEVERYPNRLDRRTRGRFRGHFSRLPPRPSVDG